MLSFSDFSMDEADSTINQTHSELHNPKPSLPPLNLVDNEELEDVDESHVHEPKSPLSFTSSKCTNVNWMDEKRINKTAYEYLCRLEEAKQWLEECLDEALPPVSELGEYLRNGIVLAKVVKKYHPDLVKKIYDAPKLQFRHSENINYFFKFLRINKLPEYFMFELTDLYDGKNIPKVVYSIHALGHVMRKKKLGPEMKDLVGKIQFTDEELDTMQANLDEAGVKLPAFSEVSQRVEEEVQNVESVVEKETVPSGDKHYKDNESKIILCQSQIRMQLVRRQYLRRKKELEANVPKFIKLQASIRGFLIRKRLKSRKEFFHSKIESIKVIQDWFRAKRQASAYRSLMSNESCSLSTISKFLYLLDFKTHDRILEAEELKKLVVKQIRQNAQLETELSELDIKIALLIKNRITMDELIKVTNKKGDKKKFDEKSERVHHKSTNSLFQLDRATRLRLEGYQSMFYLLQTQPKYLSKLLWATRDSTGDNVARHLETCLLTIFSYAQNMREEYLLLKLFENIIQLELESATTLKDFASSDPSFFRLIMHYVRGSNIREYLTTTLKSSVVSIQNCTEELEVNYLTVYKILIKEEESSSGKKSSKKAEISLEEAKSDPDVFARVKHNQTVLQGFVESVLNDIIKSQEQMPYGVRYISKLLYHALSKKFPKENKDDILKIVGSLIYYRYMNPALVSPDAFDVTYTTVSQLARKNLMEVSKLLYAICVDKNLPEGMEIDLEYKKKATTSFFEYLLQIIEVPKPEIQFNYDTFRDVARTHNPIIYISSDEIYSLHETLYNLKDTVCSSPEDPLRKLLDALGEPPSSTQTNEGHEIALTLTPVYAATHIHEDSESQHVFFLTKKAIVKLIRVYTNKRNLIDILNSPTTSQDEEIYQIQNASASPLSTSNLRLESNESLYKVNESSLQLLKENVRQMLVYLEKAGLVTEKDGYECILRSIATDIRNKYDRNDAIRREKENLERTLKILREKNEYLQLQEKSYLEYVDACTLQFSTSTVHPVKKRGSFFSFSRQARQMRQVEKKKGASPKSLTYTYSAQELLEKGIISWIDPELVPSSVLEKLEITLSSATAGVFEIKASLGVHSGIKSLDNHLSIKELDTFRLDELLSLQFENKQEISLFDGSVKGNVNLMIFLVNKSFFVG